MGGWETYVTYNSIGGTGLGVCHHTRVFVRSDEELFIYIKFNCF